MLLIKGIEFICSYLGVTHAHSFIKCSVTQGNANSGAIVTTWCKNRRCGNLVWCCCCFHSQLLLFLCQMIPFSALHVASGLQSDNLEIMKLLLDHTNNVDDKDKVTINLNLCLFDLSCNFVCRRLDVRHYIMR